MTSPRSSQERARSIYNTRIYRQRKVACASYNSLYVMRSYASADKQYLVRYNRTRSRNHVSKFLKRRNNKRFRRDNSEVYRNKAFHKRANEFLWDII